MDAPVDPTQAEAWARPVKIAPVYTPGFWRAFTEDPQRAERYSRRATDLFVDLSKDYLGGDVLTTLLELTEETSVTTRRGAMYVNEYINVTEDRTVPRTALRRPATDELTVDGQNVVAGVHEALERVYDLARYVRSDEWTGTSGKPVRIVVNVDIDGSDLGPVMAYEALEPYVKKGLECRFISNVDPTDTGEKLHGLDPETTLFVIASKTFTTPETLMNAGTCRAWLLGGLAEREVGTEGTVSKHFVAVPTNLGKIAEFGIDPADAYGFWSWVGGYYSMDPAVGTPLVIAIGPKGFAGFLPDFGTVDEHLGQAPAVQNVPLLVGLLDVWYTNFFGVATHAMLPYSQYLYRFPAYLQQLTMELNDKCVRQDGNDVTAGTGEVFWGEVGTNGQHVLYQLTHQGTQLIPADFIAFATPRRALSDGDGTDQHKLLLGNFFAQIEALAFGKTAEEVCTEGTPEVIVTAYIFPGNKPTTSIMASELTPSVLGQLIALYEHITFVQGAVWGADSYDQWGAELGRQMARDLGPAISGDVETLAAQDSSTTNLVNYYRANRK